MVKGDEKQTQNGTLFSIIINYPRLYWLIADNEDSMAEGREAMDNDDLDRSEWFAFI